MKKIILSVVAIAFAATSIMANGNSVVKRNHAKQADCTSCSKGTKCTKDKCIKPDCCK